MRQLTLFDYIEYECDIPAEVSVLSLFDGMSCGMIAMLNAGMAVKSYDAYEIDKYAIKTASHNFPLIRQHGDVFSADFAQYEGVDYVIGGSPCTYWSIAQKNNRETEASGMGWELFQQYVRAVREAKPKYFIYENNKSMSNAIRESITETFGFEPICINSALVSAQNRQRLYWVGKRDADGTYSKVDVEQPEDRGILLRDILEKGTDLTSNDKSFALTATYDGAIAQNTLERHQRSTVAEPIRIPPYGSEDKARPLNSHYSNNCGGFEHRMFSKNPNKQQVDMVAEPVCVAQRGRYSDTGNRSVKGTGDIEQFYEAREDGKTNAVTTVQKDNQICEPVRVGSLPRPNGELSNSQGMRVYSIKGKSINLTSSGGGQGAKTGLYAIPVEFEGIVPINTTVDGKAQTLRATCYKDGIRNLVGNDVDKRTAVAIPIEFEGAVPIKAVSCADGKVYTVYEVREGQITIKDKQYPIKLTDGFYVIRKLTISECKRLQTVPEWYDFSVVSNSQAYKMLGNGWTCDVISHLIRATRRSTT